MTDFDEPALRQEVRTFVVDKGVTPKADCWVSAPDPAFSEALGAQGWLGMTWPKHYGGGEKSNLERWVVTEELLAAGAPVAAHWIADRQTGPQILRYGTERQRKEILPAIVAGACFTAIGMSEAQAGSDLAAVQTKAVSQENGSWQLTGEKLWSTGAHLARYMIVLARTSPAEGRNRHQGLSQFLVDLEGPGITISPIKDLCGTSHFNSVRFDDALVEKEALLGEEGDGWAQVTGELTLERSGPERYMTSFAVLKAALKAVGEPHPSTQASLQSSLAPQLGTLMSRLYALRALSRSIATRIDAGEDPAHEAAITKDLGLQFEVDCIAFVRQLLAATTFKDPVLLALVEEARLRLFSNGLRGGTVEVMRGIIARNLGLR